MNFNIIQELVDIAEVLHCICDNYSQESTFTAFTINDTIVTVDYEFYAVVIEGSFHKAIIEYNDSDLQERSQVVLSKLGEFINVK